MIQSKLQIKLKYNLRFIFFRAFKLLFFLAGKITFKNFSKETCGNMYINLLSKVKREYKHTISGKVIYYDINNDIGRNLYLTGKFEESELKLCAEYLQQDSVVLDIGANIGLHSVFFSTITDSLIYSFEPSKKTFGKLIRNTESIDNILTFNFALSNENQIVDFYEAKDNAYSSLKDTKRKAIESISKVICLKLDDLFQLFNPSKIDFVKIDVEGFEQNVLEGMQNIISKFKPVIYCEIYKGTDSNPDPLRTINFIKKFGYDVLVIRENKIADFDIHIDIFHNYFFIPK